MVDTLVVTKNLSAALELADNGLRLHPCNGKEAIFKGWQNKASADQRTVSGWFSTYTDHNIAIATGAGSGIVVLDVDGPEGLKSLATFGITPDDTLAVKTSRGFHLYFQHPGFNVSNSASKIGRGLDIRGDGGYVMAPPSVHPSGHIYTWHNAERFDWPLVKPIPSQLLALIKNGTRREERTAKREKIEKGGRNVYLTSVVGGFWARGLSESATRKNAHTTNKEMCTPPLAESEVDVIVDSITAKPGGDMLILDSKHSELNYAHRMVLHHGGNIHYVIGMNRWYVWNGQHWEEDDTSHVAMRRRVIEMLEATYLAANTITNSDDTERIRLQNNFRDQVKFKQTLRAIDAIIGLTAAQPGVAKYPDEFDKDEYLFNVQNGTIDLRTGQIRPSDPTDLITMVAPVTHDPEADCPRWKRFLPEIFPVIPPTPADPDDDDDTGDPGRSEEEAQAIIGYIQRLIGYGLTGSVIEQIIAFFYGIGKNGKSTILETQAALMGPYWKKTRTQNLMQRRDSGIPNEIAALRGARTVVANEINQGGKLDESIVKDLTGNDSITARRLYGEPFTFKPTFTLIMYGNHKPIIDGSDEGIWRRVHLVPFTYTVPDELRERDLGDKLRDELPGILNWAIQGALDWQRTGLNPPASIIAATNVYREEMDSIGRFIEVCCSNDDDEKIIIDDLYQAYRNYSTKLGTFAKSKQNFGEDLSKHGIKKKKSNSKIYRTGITLNQEGWEHFQWQPSIGRQ